MSAGVRAASGATDLSSGTEARLSGLIVSTGAGVPFSFVVDDPSPEDDATRFPVQLERVDSMITHTITDRVYGITRFSIRHLSVR